MAYKEAGFLVLAAYTFGVTAWLAYENVPQRLS